MIENKWYNQEDIDKLYPEAVIVPPQKIGQFPGTRGISLEDICTSGEYFAQTKKDGYCYIYNQTENKSYLFSRNVSRATGLPSEKSANVPHIMEILDKIFPLNTIVIGEIYYPNKTSKDVTSVMGCLPKKAKDRQKDNPIHFYMHDIIMYEGEDLLELPAVKRYNFMLEKISYGMFLYCEKTLPCFIEIADYHSNCNLLDIAADALAIGEEGIVLKKKNGKYYPGLRPAWETIKIKKVDTVDVVCMGFEKATKEYTGKETSNYWIIEENIGRKLGSKEDIWVEYDRGTGNLFYIKSPNFRTIEVTKPFYHNWNTAIKIGVYKNEELMQIGTISSGMDDALRADSASNPNNYIGMVLECSIMEKGNGTLRHPVFKKFREDKEAKDCKYSEIFN